MALTLVANIQSWADNLDIIWIPDVEGDISNLQGQQAELDAAVNSLAQTLGDQLSAHQVTLSVLQTLVQAANATATDAILLAGSAGQQTYIDQRVSTLEAQLASSLTVSQSTIEANVSASVNAFLDTLSPTMLAEIAAAKGDIESIRDVILTTGAEIEAVTQEVLDVTVPMVTTLQANALNQITALQDDFNALVLDFPNPDLMTHFDEVRTELHTSIYGVSANLATNYMTGTSVNAAIAAASTSLSASITTAQTAADAATSLATSKGKTLYQSSPPDAADQLPQNLWIDTTNGANTPKRWNGLAWVAVTDKVATDAAAAVVTVSANLSTNYYNKVSTDGAISAAIDSFEAEFRDTAGQIKATALTNYYTKTAADSAISAATLDLKSSMEGATGSVGILSANLSNNYYTKTAADSAIASSATTLSAATSAKGKTIYSSTAPAAADQLTQNLWIDTTDGANTPKRWNGSDWVAVTDKVASDAAAAAAVANGGVSTLSGTITNILGARADLLTGTAFAGLLTQLGVSTSTGLSATVSTQASAIANLESNASALWGVKLTAGPATTAISLVAADDPTGPVSTGIFEMDNLLIRADQVLISPDNLFGDYDMMYEAAYSSDTGAAFGFVGTSSQGLGLRYLNMSASANLETVYTDWFPVTGSTDYLVRAGAWLSTNTAGSGTSTVSVETGSMASSGAITLLTTTQIKTATDTTYSGTTAFSEVTVSTDASARRMRFRIDRAAGGTASGRAGGFRVEKMAGASLIVDGGIKARHIDTGELRADHIGSGQITAGFLKIDAAMAVNDLDAGFSFGKTSPSDFSTDGLYLGRSLTNAGTTGFGFLLGSTSIGGYNQSIQHTTDAGLKLTNANFAFNTGAYTQQEITTSQTVTLPVGTTEISMDILSGGGGGGAPGTTYTSRGGTTTVQLWDGTTNTGISWSSTGGLNGGSSSGTGISSVLGTGGAPATGSYNPHTDNWLSKTAATVATGYGAGGGGGATYGAGGTMSVGKGGGAATLKSVSKYNISGLANPKLVITIGSAGSTGAAYAAAGSPGYVKIVRGTITSVNANVVPLRPTASGTFTKAANATGDTVFPDLGPGLWIISGVNSELLCLNQLRITDVGPISVKGANARSMTFVADIRPNIIVGNATAVTIVYAFYSMAPIT